MENRSIAYEHSWMSRTMAVIILVSTLACIWLPKTAVILTVGLWMLFSTPKSYGWEGPHGIFIFGAVIELRRYRKYLHERLVDYTNRFKGGNWGAIIFGKPFLVVSNPTDLKYLLWTNKENYKISPIRKSCLIDTHGERSLAHLETGKLQQNLRRQMLRFFYQKEFIHTLTSLTLENLSKLYDVVYDSILKGMPFDITVLLNHVFRDSSFIVTFGDKMYNEDIAEDLRRYIKDAGSDSNRRLVHPSWKLWKFLGLGVEGQVSQRVCHTVQIIGKILADYRKSDQQEQDHSFLKMIADFAPNHDQEDEFVIDQLLATFKALCFNQSKPIAWMIIELCRHPQIAAKIRLDSSKTTSDPVKIPTLDAFVWECMRLHPSVLINGYQSIGEDTLPSGTIVPPGCTVAFSSFVMGRSHDIWSNADQFDINRWLGPDGSFQMPHHLPYQMPEFGAGLRACIGSRFSLVRVKSILLQLLSRYDFKEACPPDYRSEYKMSFETSFIDDGVFLFAKKV